MTFDCCYFWLYSKRGSHFMDLIICECHILKLEITFVFSPSQLDIKSNYAAFDFKEFVIIMLYLIRIIYKNYSK